MIGVDRLSTRREKKLQSRNVHFQKKDPEFKKHSSFAFHDYIPQFCS